MTSPGPGLLNRLLLRHRTRVENRALIDVYGK